MKQECNPRNTNEEIDATPNHVQEQEFNNDDSTLHPTILEDEVVIDFPGIYEIWDVPVEEQEDLS